VVTQVPPVVNVGKPPLAQQRLHGLCLVVPVLQQQPPTRTQRRRRTGNDVPQGIQSIFNPDLWVSGCADTGASALESRV
jgi:hypothetical protein